MAKGQQRGNREAKKPKADKKAKPVAAASSAPAVPALRAKTPPKK
jgi:hypothetical protein